MATWKCEKCGSEKSGMIQETLIENIDDSGKYCKLKVCPECAENYMQNLTDDYLNRLSVLREQAPSEEDDVLDAKKCERCGEIISDDCEKCPYCGCGYLQKVDSESRDLRPSEHIPGLLARCEQHLRVIKGILIAGAAYLIVKELIVLFIALSK